MNNSTKLDKELELYKTHSTPSSKLSAAKILTYTAAASSAFVFSAAADAAVIYSGTQNIGLNTAVDIDGDLTNDLSFGIYTDTFIGGSAATASFKPFNDTVNRVGFIKAPAGSAFTQIQKLGAGDTIGSSAAFNFNLKASFRYGQIYTSSNSFTEDGPWSGAPGSSGFAGITIKAAGKPDIYAWLRFELTNNANGVPNGITLIDWAYEDTGASILAGQTASAVPLPGSLGLLAMGASGLAAFRRRKTSTKK